MNKKWKSIRIPEAAYDLVRAVANDGNQNIGDVAGALLSDGVADFRESVNSLAKVAKRARVDHDPIQFITGQEPEDVASPSEDVASLKNDVASLKNDVKAITASYRNGAEKNAYECHVCHEIWDVGTKPKSPCPGCGTNLTYAEDNPDEDNPDEDNQGGMSGGEKVLLFGAAVLALVGFARWQAARQPAANGVNNGVM